MILRAEGSRRNKFTILNIFKGLYKREIIIIALVLWTSAILLYIVYNYLGRSLISNMYYENSFSFLNGIIEGRSSHTLEHYFTVADGFFHKLLSLILILSAVPFFYAIFRKPLFFLSEKLSYIKESSTGSTTQPEIDNSISIVRSLLILVLTFIVTVVPLCFSKYAPLLDYPWHLARISILDNWDKSPLLQNWYELRSFILPNMGMDLITLLLAKILPVELAGRVFIAVVFAVTLSGSMFLNYSLNGRLILWPLLSSFFLFNWILLLGFLNYLLGIGFLLWAIGIWVFLSNSFPWLRLFVGTILTISLFFCHLAAVALFAVTIAGYELQRSCRMLRTSEWFAVRDLFIGASIFIAPLVLFIISSTSNNADNTFVYLQPLLWQKLVTFCLSLMSGNNLLDAATFVIFSLFIIVIILHGQFHLAKSMYYPLIILTTTYLVLPFVGLFNGAYIDTRIPIAIVFIVISCSCLTIQKKVWRRAILYGLFGFLIFRSVLLSYDWNKYDHIIQEFTSAFTSLPSGSVMFVASGGSGPSSLTGNRYLWHPPVHHLGCLATLQQEVFVPVIWAHPALQPITVAKKFKAIKKFQKNDPIPVKTPEELSAVISQIRIHVFNAGIPVTSVFLLVIEPELIDVTMFEQTELVASGSRFKLLKLNA